MTDINIKRLAVQAGLITESGAAVRLAIFRAAVEIGKAMP